MVRSSSVRLLSSLKAAGKGHLMYCRGGAGETGASCAARGGLQQGSQGGLSCPCPTEKVVQIHQMHPCPALPLTLPLHGASPSKSPASYPPRSQAPGAAGAPPHRTGCAPHCTDPPPAGHCPLGLRNCPLLCLHDRRSLQAVQAPPGEHCAGWHKTPGGRSMGSGGSDGHGRHGRQHEEGGRDGGRGACRGQGVCGEARQVCVCGVDGGSWGSTGPTARHAVPYSTVRRTAECGLAGLLAAWVSSTQAALLLNTCTLERLRQPGHPKSPMPPLGHSALLGPHLVQHSTV